LLVNSGNANAGTGKQGVQDAFACCVAVAEQFEGLAQQVLPFSTGVIGEPLPVGKLVAALPTAFDNLDEHHWDKAARAIMTTDTFPKGASVVVEIGGQPVAITGISKGAGMIQPNMATMLGFIATDANIEQALLQQCLAEAAELSFNRITVDGDTSTNDACVCLASGCSAAPQILADTESYAIFSAALKQVCKRLAELIIRDGEGATKLMRIVVEQAQSSAEALQVGKTIAHSPLVKTAFFASDPNWGRILAAVGRAGVENMDLDKIDIYLGNVCIVESGARAASYTEQDGQRVMQREEIIVTVRLGRGQAREEVLTCDFSYDYVRINAEYRT
jgi:glutamate N-acetyltransferase/amino-acid N-acetyltransferase